MADNENNVFSNEFDLGSDFGDFTMVDGKNPFDDESSIETAPATIETVAETADISSVQAEAAPEIEEIETKAEVKSNEGETAILSQAETAEQKAPAENKEPKGEQQGLFDAIISEAEDKQVNTTKGNLADKLPVFSYAKAEEEIADPSKTFDQLRNEKSEDFPELDDGTSVTWRVTYAGVTANVSDPKKTTIASVKKKIEESKDFAAKLKKMKTDKERSEVVCKVTPSVVAKKKGIISSAYKGIYANVEDAVASQKAIAYVPSGDGLIYQVRSNKIGTFIAPAHKVSILGKVRAGFNSALPKIPYKILADVISFFRAFVNEKYEYEAMCYICWDFAEQKYFVYVPKQMVSKASVTALTPEFDEEKAVAVMEIHSHNTMKAFFSSIDDSDEKATGLYAVIGKIKNFFPEIRVRASVGGSFIPLSAGDVFEGIQDDYPEEWSNNVNIEKDEESRGKSDEACDIQTC